MSATCNTGSCHPVTTPASGQNSANHQIQGSSWTQDFPEDSVFRFHRYGISSVDENETSEGDVTGSSGSWTRNTGATLTADENYQFKARIVTRETAEGSVIGSKTAAMVAAVVANPSASSITSNSATIDATYIPRVLRSSCSAQLQYKKNTDTNWTNAGSPNTTGGYSNVGISRNITGLESSTLYNMRLVITRGTGNDTELISSTTSFTTLAGEPLVTTSAATSVSHSSATLNGVLDINEGTGVNVYFKWGTDNPPTQNQTSDQSKSADGSFDQGISGLAASTTYFFQAFVSFSTPTGSPNEGSVLSFTTPSNPAADAAAEDHVFVQEFNERKYGVQSTFYFVVASPAATSSDRFFNAASPFVAGDVQISIDGGAFTNVTNLPTRIGTTAVFSIVLTAAEMAGRLLIVQFVDQDGPAYRDFLLLISTRWEQGNVDVDAGQLSNVSAFKVTGQGTGHGIEAIGGATGQDINGIMAEHFQRVSVATAGGASTVTLDASASATNDYYNGSTIDIISGTGAGQARVITDYDGTTKVATVDTSWSTNPGSGSVCLIRGGARPWDLAPTAAELTAVPAATASAGAKLQLVFQRFAFKITQTATTQTLFKADSSTSLATRSASDDGTTQTLGKLT